MIRHPYWKLWCCCSCSFGAFEYFRS